MPLSFEDEIKALALHRIEQDPAWHAATTKGRWDLSQQEGFDFLGRMINNQYRAVIRIAQEIDALRAAIDGR